jgi:amino acid adenylation domain-containing protein
MLVHRFLEDSAARNPDALALIEARRTATYAKLDRLANRFAHLCLAAGARRGDRVAIALDNSIELVAAYLGTMKAGGVAVPLPAGPRSDRLMAAVADCKPVVAVIDVLTAKESAEHLASCVPSVFVATASHEGTASGLPTLAHALESCPDTRPEVRSIDQDLAAIIYTSGTTGEPRGVMLAHSNIVANTRSIVAYLSLTDRDRMMCVLPFYYVYGLSLLHTHLAVGGSIVIDNRFAFPNVVLDSMRQHEVTGFAGVPSTFALLLHRSELDDVRLPHLRYVTQAGGSMAVARVVEWIQRGPKVPFYVMYGATEASARLTYCSPAYLQTKLGSIGRPIPNVEIEVRREDDTVCATGEIGELVARGSNIARGYWNNPEETARKFGPYGYRTGDLGYKDADGFLFLVGRRDDMIKVGAHRVGPREIEDVLHEYPGVLEVAVVGAPHDILGEVPVAFLAMRDPSTADLDGLQAFCRSRLPAHKVPTRFLLQNELPKIGSVGKVNKRALRQLAEVGPVS